MNTKKLTKSLQRKVNKRIKEYNKGFYEDNLWLGRFELRQKQRFIQPYEDGSGINAVFLFEFIDKKTGNRVEINVDKYEVFGWKMWWEINDCIVKKLKVWDENPRPSVKNPEDFRKVKIN